MSVRKLKERLDQSQQVISMLYQEIEFLKELSVGTFETVKLLPDYDEALEKQKENLTKDEKEKDELPT